MKSSFRRDRSIPPPFVEIDDSDGKKTKTRASRARAPDRANYARNNFNEAGAP